MNLEENKEKAAKYRSLWIMYIKVKNELYNRYGERIELESTMKDLRQVRGIANLSLMWRVSDYVLLSTSRYHY